MSFDSGWLARVTLRAVGEGNEWVNTLHYNQDEGFLGTDLAPSMQALADRLEDDLFDAYRGFFPSAIVVQPIVVTQEKDPLNPTAPREQRSSGTATGGLRTLSGDRVPHALTTLITERTSMIGRSFRGRMFLPGPMVEGDVDGENVVTGSAYYNAAQAFMNAIPLAPDIVFGPSTVGTKLVVFSRTRRSADLDPYLPEVTSLTWAPRLRWLRRRQPE